MAKDSYMEKLFEKISKLKETFKTRDEFEKRLKDFGLDAQIPNLDDYIKAGILIPLEIGKTVQFHFGHILILARFMGCSKVSYEPIICANLDFEDIMLRRAYVCDLEAENIRIDAQHIHQFFAWLFGDDFKALIPTSLSHTKAVIDIVLDKLDPSGLLDSVQSMVKSDGNNEFKLFKTIIGMHEDMENIVMQVSQAGVSIPSTQYILNRKQKLDEVSALFEPLVSKFLASPSRDISADERIEFLKERNTLLANQSYQGLIDLYENNQHLFDADFKRHGALYVCLGNIYSHFLNDHAKAAELFKEALDHDPSNATAYEEIDRELRAVGNWTELVDRMSNRWDSIEDTAKRCAMILECAQIQAFKLQNINEAIGLYERCMREGHPGNCFDDLYKIIAGLMTDCTQLDKLRALVILTTHVVNYAQCDKIIALQKENDSAHEPLGRYMSLLIDAGIQSFKGDQPMALEILCDAIALAPRNTLMDGLFLRIASKIQSPSEFKEAVSKLESESLSNEDFASVWYRIANTLMKTTKLQHLAMDYAELAVAADNSNLDALDLCINLATQQNKLDRQFIYSTLKASKTKDPKAKNELENTSAELKLALEDNDELRFAAYETLIQYDDVKDNIIDDLKSIIASADDNTAISCLKRIESKCMGTNLSGLVGELYQAVLEREISDNLKKELLEKYLGCLLGQGSNMDIDTFITIHAQLYILAPSDRLFTMLKNTAAQNTDAIRTWAGNLEDAVVNIHDKIRVQKIHVTLADCYQNILKDLEKTAEAFANLFKVAPDNIAAFKCAFNTLERLERYYDCTEIFQTFPSDKLSIQERVGYAMKCLSFAMFHLYDGNAMGKFLNIITGTDPKLAPKVVDQLLEKAASSEVDKDQLVCFFEQLEKDNKDITALTLRSARIKLLTELDRFDSAAELLDQTTYNLSKALNLIDYVKKSAKAFEDKKDDYANIYNLWFTENSATNETGSGKSTPTNNTAALIESLVKEYAENIDDDSFAMVIDNALNALTKIDATTLCLKLGELNESKERMTEAEAYYKKAFGYTVNLELIEFYKRRRKFKTALKILTPLCEKITDDVKKNSIRMDIAKLHEKRNDFASAAKVLEDVIASRAGLDKATVIALLRQKADYHIATSNPQDAIAALKQASAESDIKSREEIDIDTCLLMREIAPADAKKLQQSLMLRGAKSEKMVYLTLCFDIDNEKYIEAKRRLDELLKSSNPLIKGLAYEQQLRMHQKRGDSVDDMKQTAAKLLEIVPTHPEALKIMG